MVRGCNTGWACNVFRNIDPDFIVHYFLHGGESCNFAPQFSWGPVQIVQEISECTRFSLVAVFYNCGGSPLAACTPAISWQCFWACGSHTLQAYSRQAQTRVRVRYRVKPLLLHLKVIDVKFKERPFSFYPYFGSLSLHIQEHNSVLAYLSRNNWQ